MSRNKFNGVFNGTALSQNGGHYGPTTGNTLYALERENELKHELMMSASHLRALKCFSRASLEFLTCKGVAYSNRLTNSGLEYLCKYSQQTVLIVLLTSSIKCSQVLDAESQKGIYVSDYCPKMKYCMEGAHVMCMYYDKENQMGPKCSNAVNVTITSNLANTLLDVTNALRSKISRGVEKGKNGDALPRGYGIFRLKWDSELATFAQVLANQCVLRHDFCRATKKFPDPGQTVSIVRFHGPNWIPASKSKNFTTKGPTEEKLEYAVTQSLRTWYAQKSAVDIHMVTNYPDWSNVPSNQKGRLYLTMTYGSATHMGCGISAYNDYTYYTAQKSLLYNTVLVVCNFSAQPRLHAGVYNTVPPTDTESSFNACGCPIGSLEDDDCLCLDVTRGPDPPIAQALKAKCSPGVNCDPTVVLLPIFTMEDAPPEKLIVTEGFSNTSLRQNAPETENTVDSFEELIDNNVSGNKEILRKSRKTLDLQVRVNTNNKRQRLVVHNNEVTVRNRHFDKENEVNEHTHLNHHENKKRHMQGHIQVGTGIKRSSVFGKTPIFELPGSHYFLSSIKRDVIPRKDFSPGKQLVTKYLYSKNNKHHIILPKNANKFEHSIEKTANDAKSIENGRITYDLRPYAQPKEYKVKKEHHEEVRFHDILTTETSLHTAEQKIINHKDSNEMNEFQDAEKLEGNTGTDENDKKFMALLDTLEQEVKHIELHDKEKQIFDAKIKKIYGKVVGKHSKGLLVPEKNHVERPKQGKHHDDVLKHDDEDTVVHKLPPPYDTKDEESNIVDELSYPKHITDTEIDEKYPITETDVEPDTIERPIGRKPKSPVSHGARETYNRRDRNFRQKKRNYLNSLELVRQRYDNEFKGRNTYKNAFRNDNEKLRHRTNSLDFKKNKNYYGNDAYEDILSAERRKYYQDKLDSMEKKLQDARRYNRRKDARRSPHLRAMKQSLRSENQINSLYTGRARILHGY